MRYFQSNSPVCFIDRDLTHYPSRIRASKAADAVSEVMDVSPEVCQMVNNFLAGESEFELSRWLTPTQFQAVVSLSFWLGGEAQCADTEYHVDLNNDHRAFVFADLNTGRCIVFVALKLRNSKDPLSLDGLTAGEVHL